MSRIFSPSAASSCPNEAIRQWREKFGLDYARKLKRREGRLGDHWHLDEVFIRIRGELHYLWRAVDQDGIVLDIPLNHWSDVDRARELLLQEAQALAEDPEWADTIIEDPAVWGVQAITHEAISLRLVLQTEADDKDTVARKTREGLDLSLEAGEIVVSAETAAAARSLLITIAAGRPCPTTSPTDIPILPGRSNGVTEYQSPPTRIASPAGW